MTATMPTVRERPVLMTGPMVRAILEGRKSQTRRVVKPQPTHRLVQGVAGLTIGMDPAHDGGLWYDADGIHPGREVRCPYGAPLDRLWVRETWDVGFSSDEQWVRYRAGDEFVPQPSDRREAIIESWDNHPSPTWRPSIHMPRWASRITLEITDIRVERVQDISEDDARAEGARRFDDIPDSHPYGQGDRWSMGRPASSDECLGSARFAFANLWNALNAARGFGWDENPWCWVISFRRITP